ncbi:MAG: hypothetical protein J6I84_04140 [Bacilli bacterium]|nr:hypothetical protein [Bacilli bacterium]
MEQKKYYLRRRRLNKKRSIWWYYTIAKRRWSTKKGTVMKYKDIAVTKRRYRESEPHWLYELIPENLINEY